MNELREYLPSRKVVAFFIVPAVTIFSLWGIGQIRESRAEQAQKQQANFQGTLATAVNEYNGRDTDGDLLQDWEEFLYETDIEKRDTDGDGLDDYQEVLDPIRDPLVPDAELGRTVATSSDFDNVVGDGPYYAYDENLNTTEKFSRDIFNTFVQIQQSEDPEAVEGVLIERVTEIAASREREEAEYTLEDITVVPSAGKQKDRERYLEQYKNVLTVLDSLQGKPTEMELLEEYSQYKNPNNLKTIEQYSQQYELFIQGLLGMRVTSEISGAHLELVNNYDIWNRNVYKMSQAEVDPIAAIAGTSAYFDDQIFINNTINALSKYLYSN